MEGRNVNDADISTMVKARDVTSMEFQYKPALLLAWVHATGQLLFWGLYIGLQDFRDIRNFNEIRTVSRDFKDFTDRNVLRV